MGWFGENIFVHASTLEQAELTGLHDDQKVAFQMRDGRDGRASAIGLATLD